MGVKYFGQFLIERGVVTADQLLKAVDLQAEKNLDFGGACVKLGLLDARQAQGLNDKQRFTDKRIGELARDEGLLREAQVTEVLTYQRNSHLHIGQALVQLGHISPVALESELAAFKADQAIYEVEKLVLPAGTEHAEAISAMVDLGRKLLLRIAKINSKVGVPRVHQGETLPGQCMVSLTMHSGSELEAYLELPLLLAHEVNRGMLGIGPKNPVPDDAVDAVKEFLNVVAGNVCAKLAQSGKTYEITPPKHHPGGVRHGHHQLLVCPLQAADREIIFAFAPR